MQGLGDFCVEPNDVLEDMASNYVEKGKLVISLHDFMLTLLVSSAEHVGLNSFWYF